MEGNIKEINTTDALKSYKGARVLWPPDCPDDILDHVIILCKWQLSSKDIDQDGVKIAENIKKYMDEHFGLYWHVVCGRHFGSYAIHESNRFMFFYLDNIAFMIYKSE